MKLANKVIIPIAVVFILLFSILISYIIESERSIVSEFKNSTNTLAIEQFDLRNKETLDTHNDYLDFIAFLASKIAVEYVYNYETVNIEPPLSKFLSLNSIDAILVYDTIGKENFITLYKDKNGKSVRVKKLPDVFNSYKKFKKIMTKTSGGGKEEIFGYVVVYYNENLLKRAIEKKHEMVLTTLNTIENRTNNDMEKMIKNQTIFILFMVVISSVFIFLMVQRFVLTPLSKVKVGLDGFFLFLQNKKDSTKKIELNSTDEFGQMAKSLNENISVSARLHEEIYELNTNLEKRVKEKTKKVTTLLDNAGQGFLSFDSDFIIDEEYSKECHKLFGCNIAGKDISTLLFEDKEKRNFFKKTLSDAVTIEDDFVQESLLSLLPSSLTLNRRALKMEYKILENQKFMLVITNITSQRKLEKKIKKEQDILKMIVAVVSESDTFYELKKDYAEFANSCELMVDRSKTPLFNLSEVYRTVHTFKGTFSQLYMKNSMEFLHNLESVISQMIKDNCDSNNELKTLLKQKDFNESLQKDFAIIKDVLGEEFLDSVNFIKIDLNDIHSLQKKIAHLLEQKETLTLPCQDVLCQVQSLTSQKLLTLLKPYIKLSQQLAQRLEKEIYEFEIIGDKELVVPHDFKPFIKSLIHIFRNSIDHGIENPETRVLKGKDEKGTLLCNFEIKDDYLHIMISDDGAGIDCEKIKSKLSHKDINLEGFTRSEIFNFIFDENFSTKDEISNISGRGIGMSSIKFELNNLNGEYEIQSKEDVGTTFVFKLPLKKEQYNKNLPIKDYMLEPLLKRSISFLREDLNIKVMNENFDMSTPKTIELNENSAVIATHGTVKNNIAISYERKLLDKITEQFFESENSDDENMEGIAQNVSAEILNIIVGNALKNPIDDSVLGITPPSLINEKKIMGEHKNAEVAMAIIKTEFGNMVLYVFGPKELFEYEFKGL